MNEPLGKHWILLRGLARESAHWGSFVTQLQDAFPSSRISLIDLPGTGYRYKEISPLSIRKITASLRADADAKGLLDQPISLLGLSLGGMAAWEWLCRHPSDIAGAVLINTSFADLSPFYRRLHLGSFSALASWAFKRDLKERESRILKLVSNRSERHESVIDEWTRIQQARPVSTQNALRQIAAAARYKAGNRKPQSSVLLINGLGDRLVSPACTASIQKKWGLERQSHPHAGHDLPLDDGEWLATQLQDWVSRVKESSMRSDSGYRYEVI